LPHEKKQALPCIKQNLQATYLHVTVEFAIYRSQGGVGVEYFYDLRRRSGCGAKSFGGGANASQKNETPSISESNTRLIEAEKRLCSKTLTSSPK